MIKHYYLAKVPDGYILQPPDKVTDCEYKAWKFDTRAEAGFVGVTTVQKSYIKLNILDIALKFVAENGIQSLTHRSIPGYSPQRIFSHFGFITKFKQEVVTYAIAEERIDVLTRVITDPRYKTQVPNALYTYVIKRLNRERGL